MNSSSRAQLVATACPSQRVEENGLYRVRIRAKRASAGVRRRAMLRSPLSTEESICCLILFSLFRELSQQALTVRARAFPLYYHGLICLLKSTRIPSSHTHAHMHGRTHKHEQSTHARASARARTRTTRAMRAHAHLHGGFPGRAVTGRQRQRRRRLLP